MAERYKVVKSRKWHEPEIETYVTAQEVGAMIGLDDFIAAIVEEVGNPTTMVTKKQLTDKLQAAALVVLNEVGSHTARVV